MKDLVKKQISWNRDNHTEVEQISLRVSVMTTDTDVRDKDIHFLIMITLNYLKGKN